MKKFFALLLAVSTIILFGCKAKTPATSSSSSSDLDIQVIAPVSSDTSSAADSSVLPSSSSSKAVSPQPKTNTPSGGSHAAISASNNDTQIADENARHAAALKSLEDAKNANMAVFDQLDNYHNEQITIINNLATEKDETKISQLNEQKKQCETNIFLDLKKVVPILYPDLKNMKYYSTYSDYFSQRNKPVSFKILRNEMQLKYDKDVADENSKHNAIIKQLS